jgi:hypothetical protein
MHEHAIPAGFYEDDQGSIQNEDSGTHETLPLDDLALDNFSEIFDLFCQQNTASEPEYPCSPQMEIYMPSEPTSATLYSPASHDMVHESLSDYASQDDGATLVQYSPGVSMVRVIQGHRCCLRANQVM